MPKSITISHNWRWPLSVLKEIMTYLQIASASGCLSSSYCGKAEIHKNKKMKGIEHEKKWSDKLINWLINRWMDRLMDEWMER